MTTKVFIDGKAGTTGLRIYERLQERNDIELLTLSEEDRKNPECRKKMLNSCDIAFLCLPDDASREAIAMIENPDVWSLTLQRRTGLLMTGHTDSPNFRPLSSRRW